MTMSGAATSSSGVPGWYGKLSTLGDFASRRLPPAAVQVLDHWLSEVVAGSRQQLGDDWLQQYLASPLQRFVLGPGLLDAAWWFGVMMPSCDKVGRYFPLIVLQPRAAPPSDRVAFDHLELWWQGVGEAALETLSDDVDVERFDRALVELPPWPAVRETPGWTSAAMATMAATTATTVTTATIADVGAAGEFRLPEDCAPGDMAQGLAAAAWMQRLQAGSLWWSWRPQRGETACRIVAGLPSATTFAAMLGPSA